jgi:hypothetical protein
MIATALVLASLVAGDASAACPATALRPLLGRAVDDDARAEVDRLVRPSGRRWIPAGSAVTQDWVPERVNLDVAKDGRIVRIWCG